MQCEKEEFVELLENLDQNETNFDYNTGKSYADPLLFYLILPVILTVFFRYLPSRTNGGEYVHLTFCISVFDKR